MSNETKWTPGPWEIERMSDGDIGIVGDIHDVGEDEQHCTTLVEFQTMSEANAHLIAAAPELYEALLWIRDNYPQRGPDGYPNLEWLAKTDAALSKARGES